MRRRTTTLLALVALLLPLSAAAAFAQLPIGGGGVSCDPADPDPGTTTDCTAEGLEADSDFQWTAEFAGGTTVSGDGTADAEGVGTFTVDVPDEEGEYTVTVTGTAEGGEPYEQTHTGTVGGASPLDGILPGETESPTEESTEGGGESPDEETSPTPESQVSPVPEGGVATGAGGDSGSPALAVVIGLLALAGVGGTALLARTHLSR